MKSASNDTDRLKLRSRVTDCFFVYGESLSEEFVGDFLEASLIGYLTTGDKKPKAKIRSSIDPSIKCGYGAVHELEQSGGL